MELTRVKINENSYDVELIGQKVRVNGREIPLVFGDENKIMLNGNWFRLDYTDDGDPSLMIVNGISYLVSKGQQSTEEIKQLVAPISGRILDILVKSGSQVKKGQLLLVLEAMKMENQIKSPVTTNVLELKVQVGQTVKAGQVLVTFE
jgi:biotin carboxyl carrier protein